MEHIYVYMYISDGTCHTAMDTNEMNGVEYQLHLLFLELPSPMHTQATSLACSPLEPLISQTAVEHKSGA